MAFGPTRENACPEGFGAQRVRHEVVPLGKDAFGAGILDSFTSQLRCLI
jgi:hypothetical protein